MLNECTYIYIHTSFHCWWLESREWSCSTPSVLIILIIIIIMKYMYSASQGLFVENYGRTKTMTNNAKGGMCRKCSGCTHMYVRAGGGVALVPGGRKRL